MSQLVGSGVMVLAYAVALQQNGINYQKQLVVTANDIDFTAVYMTYIQLSLWHIPAIVTRGNYLTNEVREVFYTPAFVMDNWISKLNKQSQFEEYSEAA